MSPNVSVLLKWFLAVASIYLVASLGANPVAMSALMSFCKPKLKSVGRYTSCVGISSLLLIIPISQQHRVWDERVKLGYVKHWVLVESN